MPREALLLTHAQQGRSSHLEAEVALLRGHLGASANGLRWEWVGRGRVVVALAGWGAECVRAGPRGPPRGVPSPVVCVEGPY